MSPAGSTSDGPVDPKATLILRPKVTKTFLKGLIAIGVFSLVLEVSPANLVHYLEFLAISVGMLLVGVAAKAATRFEISEEGMTVKRLFRAVESVRYPDILDVSVSQGVLARRFDCGTVFMILRKGGGSVRLLGGGVAEQLEDVPRPAYVAELLSSRLSPFTGGVDDAAA